jgi:hypothetical protein
VLCQVVQFSVVVGGVESIWVLEQESHGGKRFPYLEGVAPGSSVGIFIVWSGRQGRRVGHGVGRRLAQYR